MNEKIFYASGKNKLCGILNKVNTSDLLVVICHARASSKDSKPTTLIAESLTKTNINNFRFDFLACGESTGDTLNYAVTNMLINLEDTLQKMKEDYGFNNFILIGCSMGARIISLINHKHFYISKIILWYGALNYKFKLFNLPSHKEKIAKKQGYYPIEKGIKLSYDYFVDERKYFADKNLSKWDVPKLFIHGTNDPYVNYKSSVKVSHKCQNAQLILIKNGDHGFHNEECMNLALEETLKFIQK